MIHQINNDIEYSLFENVIDGYYLDSQIRDDFTCTKACYTHNYTNNTLDAGPQCTHTYDYISQQLDSLADTKQQHKVYTSKVDASFFTSDTSTQCAFNIIPSNLEMEADKQTEETPQNSTGIHFHSVRSNLDMHLSDTPSIIQQLIQRPHLLERVYKPIRNPHWCGVCH